MGLRALLYVLLSGVGAVFAAAWGRSLAGARRAGGRGDPATEFGAPGAGQTALGFGTNFFDTLGIGSFAPTTSLFRLLRMVPDDLIPGTLLVGHALPTVAQALIYITIVPVDALTLTVLIGAALAGSWLGAGVVTRLPRRRIQVGLGAALLVAAVVMAARLLQRVPAGEALGLGGMALAVGVAGNLVLGALMTIGLGAYAPSLVLFGLLGMNPKSIFPVMMGSCALLMPISGVRFFRRGRYALRASLGLAAGGVPGVLIAAYLVRELPLRVVSWLVVAIVVYTAVALLKSALTAPSASPPPPSSPKEP